MANIIGGIGVSHTPTIGFAQDKALREQPAWKPVFEQFDKVGNYLEDKQPDALVFIYNDHITSFFFDHYSPFTLGVDDTFSPADEGGGARDYPPVSGHPALARHIGQSLFADEFDLSFFQKKPIDHGLFSPLSMMTDRGRRWDNHIIPLQIGVLQFPIPTASRCFKLGKALRRAIESYPEDINVAIVATGGLSHQVHGERCGFNNPDWDEQFLDLLESDPSQLASMTHADYARLGGLEGAEVIMWLIMRGALSEQVDCLHRATYLPSMTNIATVIFQDKNSSSEDEIEAHQQKVAEQLTGIGDIPGTHPFTLERAHNAWRLNHFLHKLIEPAHRQQFVDSPDTLFAEYGLTEQEISLLNQRDWIGLIHYGVIFFSLEKMAAVLGMTNIDIYAQMRGETVEEFQQSRNSAITYSVAGKEKS